jgi:hypothetical protein
MADTRFPVLLLLTVLTRAAGILCLFAGLGFAVYQGFLEPLLPHHYFAAMDGLEAVAGGMLALLGLVAVLAGETAATLLTVLEDVRRSGFPT